MSDLPTSGQASEQGDEDGKVRYVIMMALKDLHVAGAAVSVADAETIASRAVDALKASGHMPGSGSSVPPF